MHRVLCFGGRLFRDYQAVHQVLGQAYGWLGGEFLVIEGEAPGADQMCRRWAIENGYPLIAMPAPWHKYGKRAGTLRNTWMLVHGKPTYAIGFPGGSGTRNMIEQLTEAGVPLWLPFKEM